MPSVRRPSPATAPVTSNSYQVLVLTAPSVDRTGPSMAGRLLYVTVVSPQDVLLIFAAEPPLMLPFVVTYSRSFAEVTVLPVRPASWNFREACLSGEGATESSVMVTG